MEWRFRNHCLKFDRRPRIMGIVNVTPDSFSDGGRFHDRRSAVEHGISLINQGADILDIGGESSRPGAQPVTLQEELDRVLPVVAELASRTSVPISVDTVKAEVARRCLSAGASIINDISSLTADPEMAAVAAECGAGVVLMHMQGTPATMQLNPTYGDVVREVSDYLAERIAAAESAGIDRERMAIDPGIGFGKTLEHTLRQLRELNQLTRHGRPILLGVSRKGFIGQITGRPREARAVGSVAVAVRASTLGSADIWRVHDVAEHVDAARLLAAISEPAVQETR